MTDNPQQTTFVYDGTEYDVSGYSTQHPGGKIFIDNMKAERKDFTEYFKALHSQKAEKILKSFPIISQQKPSADSQIYQKIHEKVKHLYKPRWSIQILLITFVASTFITGCLTSMRLLSIICFALSQILSGWMGHSMNHSRDFILHQVGRIFSPLLGGFSYNWWSPKHNMHHMFTNSMLYDDDIKHQYKMYLYPFLYLKWRFDAFYSAVAQKNYIVILCLVLNYTLLLSSGKNIIYFIIGQLFAGFFSANILIGNHQRQKRYSGKIQSSFIDHQITTSRNYRQNNIFWLLLMGGMQYQTEHHMFPQIPFYNVPQAANIIKLELDGINRSIVYGPVL